MSTVTLDPAPAADGLRYAVVRRRVVYVSSGALIAVVALGFRLLPLRSLTNDHYMHLAWARQVLFGALPGRDFVEPGMPLMVGLSALVQWVAPGPFGEALLGCCMLTVAALAVFAVVTRLTGSIGAAGVSALFLVASSPRLYSYPKVLVPAVALLLIHRYAERPGRSRLIALALWTAVAVLLRHDLGIYATVGVAAALTAAHWRQWVRLLRAATSYGVAVVAALTPYVAYVQWAEGLREHFYNSLQFGRMEAHQRLAEWPAFPFVAVEEGVAAWSRTDSAVLLFYVIHAATAAAAILVAARRRRPDTVTVGAGVAMLILYSLVILRHPLQVRVQDLGALLAIVGGWVVVVAVRAALTASRMPRARTRTLACGGAAVAALGVSAAAWAGVWHLENVTERIAETRVADGWPLIERTMRGVRDTGTTWPWERYWPAGPLPEAIRYIDACTAPGEFVMVTWNAPEYYFFSRRQFAGGHALLLASAFTAERDQRRILERLERERAAVVLINETSRPEFAQAFGAVDAYLRRHYDTIARFDIYDGSVIAVALHRNATGRGSYGETSWPCGLSVTSTAASG